MLSSNSIRVAHFMTRKESGRRRKTTHREDYIMRKNSNFPLPSQRAPEENSRYFIFKSTVTLFRDVSAKNFD